jgi:hypothetical protein
MDRSSRRPDEAARAFWSWLGFWLQFLILGVLVVVGAFVASGAERQGEYTCGVVLSLAAIALGFLRLKRHFDSDDGGWLNFLLVDTMQNLALVIPLFVVIGLAGLFIACLGERRTACCGYCAVRCQRRDRFSQYQARLRPH